MPAVNLSRRTAGEGSGRTARTFPTQSGCVRVPRVGECTDKLHAWPLFIRDKSRMR